MISGVVRFTRSFCAVLVVALGGMFTLCSSLVRTGVMDGLSLCANVVVPALFAFFCLCEFASLSGLMVPLGQLFRPLLWVSLGRYAACGGAVALCILGGYPMGAVALRSLHRQGVLQTEDIRRLSLFVFCPSPAFVTTGVGQGMLSSSLLGGVLWGSCVVSMLMMGGFLCHVRPPKHVIASPTVGVRIDWSQVFGTAVYNAVQKMLTVCGTVLISSIAATFIGLLIFSEWFRLLLIAFLEPTGGSTAAIDCGVSLPILGAILSFGGLSTHLQCKTILGDGMPRYGTYLVVRLVQSSLSAFLIYITMRLFPQALPTLSTGGHTVSQPVSPWPCLFLLLTCVVFLGAIGATSHPDLITEDQSPRVSH